MRRREVVASFLTATTIGRAAGHRIAMHGSDAIASSNITAFGAVGDGTADDSAAFVRFQRWAQAQKTGAVLFIPAGNYRTPSANAFWTGIPNLTIYGYGATVSDFGKGGGFPISGGQAYIQSTIPGSQSVTLLTPSQASMFAVGDWIAVGSLEMQNGGFPPNLYYNEYHQIASMDPTTGVIWFNDYVRYAHLSTFPLCSGNFANAGGPAAIYLMDQDWSQNVVVHGLTVLGNQGNEIFIRARSFRCVDMSFGYAVAPTEAQEIVFERCVFANAQQIEVDKNISILKFIDCTNESNAARLVLQSASVGKLVVDGCKFSSLTLSSVKSLVLRNSYFNAIDIGGEFGRSEAILLENVTAASFRLNATANYMLLSDATFSNGTFEMSMSNSNIQQMQTVAIPGATLFFADHGGDNWGNPFKVLAVRSDTSGNMYMDTSLSARPSYSGSVATVDRVAMHPAAKVTAINCGGCPELVDLSNAGVASAGYQFARRLLVGPLPTSSGAIQIPTWGALASITVNVIRPYAGAQSAIKLYLSFWFLAGGNVKSDVFQDAIDLKVVGIRRYMPNAGNVTVAPSDSMTSLGSAWFPATINVQGSVDTTADTLAQQPVVEITIRLDQGITTADNLGIGPAPTWVS